MIPKYKPLIEHLSKRKVGDAVDVRGLDGYYIVVHNTLRRRGFIVTGAKGYVTITKRIPSDLKLFELETFTMRSKEIVEFKHNYWLNNASIESLAYAPSIYVVWRIIKNTNKHDPITPDDVVNISPCLTKETAYAALYTFNQARVLELKKGIFYKKTEVPDHIRNQRDLTDYGAELGRKDKLISKSKLKEMARKAGILK